MRNAVRHGCFNGFQSLKDTTKIGLFFSGMEIEIPGMNECFTLSFLYTKNLSDKKFVTSYFPK